MQKGFILVVGRNAGNLLIQFVEYIWLGSNGERSIEK